VPVRCRVLEKSRAACQSCSSMRTRQHAPMTDCDCVEHRSDTQVRKSPPL
jgi:hypothetical protein